jgi:hypothetical protein
LEEGEDFPDMDELLKPTLIYQATGKTYPYRGELTSWGWHWNDGIRAWEFETDDDNDACLEAIRRLPGVVVVVVSNSAEGDAG